MTHIDPIYVGTDALSHLIQYCEQHGLKRFTLIADSHTYAALGERVEHALIANGYDVKSVILEGAEVAADERYIVQALLGAQLGPTTFIAVGSGTVPDITDARSSLCQPRRPSMGLRR